MTTNLEDQEVIIRSQEREMQRASKIGKEFTPEAWQEYRRVEDERAKQGYPGTNELKLDHRTYNQLRRFGTQTVVGVFELFVKDLKPEEIGEKRLEEIRLAVNGFIERYAVEHPEAIVTITVGPESKQSISKVTQSLV